MNVDDAESSPAAWTNAHKAAVVLLDSRGTVVQWSAGAEAIFGFSRGDAVGRAITDLIVPEALRGLHPLDVATPSDGVEPDPADWTLVVPVVDSRLRRFPVELTLVTVPGTDSELNIAVMRDPDDTQRPGTAVQSDLLQQVFERAPEAIALLDLTGRQHTINRHGALLFGYSADDTRSIDGRNLIHPDDREISSAGLASVQNVSHDPHQPFRYRVLDRTGGWRWIETLLTDLTDVPEVGAVVAFSRDVTADEERRAELDAARHRAQEVADEMRRIAEAQIEFVASVSHELRTPLSSISSAAELLLGSSGSDPSSGEVHPDTTASGLVEVDRSYLSLISRNAHRLSRFVDDLLTVTGMDHGIVHLEIGVVDITTLVADATRDAAVRTGRDVQLTIGEVTAPVIRADAVRLRQVLDNLVENAVKYSTPASAIRTSIVGSADRVWISVDNDGPEITAHDAATIFEPFVRSERGTPHRQGAGLGLALSRGITELHHGSLVCDSTRRGGARFVVDLPVIGPAG